MTRLTRLALTSALCLTFGLPAAAQDAAGATSPAPEAGASADPSTVVATVGGTDITLGHMIAMRSRLPEQYNQIPQDQLFQGVLDQLIQQEALSQQAESASQRVELVVENERRALMANEVLASAVQASITDEALQQAYDATYADAEPTPEYNASHILVETEEEARQLKTQLEEGADFAQLAQEHSTGPSGPSGGELGWFGPGMMVPEFEEAVADLEAGEVSEPVQTQFGWHLVKLNEQREQTPPSLEEASSTLAQQIQMDAVQQTVDQAISGAEVERQDVSGIDPSVLNDTTLLD
ncbi:peptidylprolyl isomerase [Roseitranquillus sediminis]|uniref:peptidylprolyl isomerase n=1 Tax=Roseitranquillus sediminis TaxID=2809051 RepID=UPI001D0C6A85|nr:peptidylprolyl isomerase [Roseitranquillus sediminis]MBM9593771.1 peptidylprolyl isomerase [Roseitranquillus sediminis]